MELTEKFLITWWVLLYVMVIFVLSCTFIADVFIMKEEAFICFLAHNFVGRYGWRDKNDLVGTVESGLNRSMLPASYERNKCKAINSDFIGFLSTRKRCTLN